MKLKKTCYDPAISRVTVKRYGLVGVLYTIGIILITVGFINPVHYGEALSDVQNLCTTMPFINLVYAALLTQLLLGDLYGKPAVVCDTHCIRIANRLGLASGKEPEKVERQLRAILPPEESSDFCHRIVLFGREVCTARSPHCDRCELRPYCREFSGE